MKKKLFFLAAAAVALASCSSDETTAVNSSASQANQPKEIAFSPFAQAMTRGAVAIDGAFPIGYNFFISAYAVDAAGDYFGKAEYTREGDSGNTWSGVSGQKQYWPLSAETLNFLAVTKSDAEGTNTTFGTANAKYASKVVVSLGDNRTAQHDLMYAVGRGIVTQSGNTLTYTGNSAGNAAPVDMVFKHALSWVTFTVQTAANYSNFKLNSIF